MANSGDGDRSHNIALLMVAVVALAIIIITILTITAIVSGPPVL